MKLYHGSDIRITQIDLNRCEPFKDFGKGFYTTSISRHANERAANIADENLTSPVTTIFDFDEKFLTNEVLSVKQFLKPSEEWVKFVMHCRDRKIPQPPHNYDIVEGPIANDKMRTQFALFERGAIDMKTVLKRITYIENTHQISFHTPAAIALLKPEPDYPQLMIETIIGMLAEYLVEDRNCSFVEALDMVYNSTTYEKLINRSTTLYRESPAYVYEILKKELA
ncbi:hypothetical protein AGMMS50239_14380 [Bacteroidia bacterium]|nr:hypothetical protein AGMMS50239_14380 [Bacteroidia bacterium]